MATVHAKKVPSTTMVLRARVRQQYVTVAEWAALRECQQPAALRKLIAAKRPDLHVEDLFRLEHAAGDSTWLVRIRAEQMQAWMTLSEFPISHTPLGSLSQDYRIIWDKTVDSVTALRRKYERLDGYAGPVLTEKGLGARFEVAKIDQARC